MTITSKSTKAEILAAYNALLEEQQAQTITAPLARNTARIIYRETVDFAKDARKLASLLYQWISGAIDTLRQPVLIQR